MNLFPLLIVLVTLVVMEIAVTLFHRFVMHGPGWGWHRSHHALEAKGWEANDFYAVVFTVATIGLFASQQTASPLWWVALGITLYGLLYALLHDVLIHRRIRLPWKPRHSYLQRLIRAHHMHHAVRTREHGISFGFLYAPPLDKLRAQLRSRHPHD